MFSKYYISGVLSFAKFMTNFVDLMLEFLEK